MKQRTCLATLLVLLIIVAATLVCCAPNSPTEPTEPAASTAPTETETPSTTEATEAPTTEPTTEATEPSTEPTEPPTEADPIEMAAQSLLETMSLEEKVCQMFFVSPTTLTGYAGATVAGKATRAALAEYPVGGIIYFGENVVSAEQVVEMVAGTQSYSKIPLFIGVDEEGGRVSRLSGVGLTTRLSPMAVYGAAGDAEAVRAMGRRLGEELSAAGFNVDFAPVADVVTNPDNTEIGDRAFSSDAGVAAEMVAAMTEGLQEGGTIACLKHFPGHGSTSADSHLGLSLSQRTLEELRETELLPIRAGLDAGAGMVMISHMSLPNVVGDNTPCDLSYTVVTELLREDLGYTGVVITDSHQMGSITEGYGCGTAAVMAIQAGCDIVLLPMDLEEAVSAVLAAVEDSTLTEARIDESVLRILSLKYTTGIIPEI